MAGYIIRRAEYGDRWALQKLVWQFELEEVLELDIRVIGYKFLSLGIFSLLLGGQVWLIAQMPILLQLILAIAMVWIALAIIKLVIQLWAIIVNILLGAILNWSRFWVIAAQQEIIGCGVVTLYGNHASLSYLFIKPLWRQRGLGSYFLKHLLTTTKAHTSLVCKPKLIKFYGNCGFKLIPWQEKSPIHHLIYRLFLPHPKLIGFPLVLMEYRDHA